jgi:hypothetical protein
MSPKNKNTLVKLSAYAWLGLAVVFREFSSSNNRVFQKESEMVEQYRNS